ncbi:MAG: ATP-binding protein, partial [Chloroflexota bacterium]
IHSHILFRLPAAAERAQIWKSQLHPDRTPLGPDVDFDALGREFVMSGGDIKNAVLKAAQLAASEARPDDEKRIEQRHFIEGASEVLAAREAMGQ